jgi:hypothetical protein
MPATNDSTVLATPNLIPTMGGWMAVSTRESRLQIGVVAETKERATLLFHESLAAWRNLLESSGNTRTA